MSVRRHRVVQPVPLALVDVSDKTCYNNNVGSSVFVAIRAYIGTTRFIRFQNVAFYYTWHQMSQFEVLSLKLSVLSVCF